MDDKIQLSYQAIKDRGLITKKTTIQDFISKMKEELKEIEAELDLFENCNNKIFKRKYQDSIIEETLDLVTVCINLCTHLNYDFETEFLKCLAKNMNRAKSR